MTSLSIIPTCLVRKGHDCTVGSLYMTAEDYNGIHYQPVMTPLEPSDVVVYNRNMLGENSVRQALQNKSRVIWWLHDIVDPRYLNDSSFRKVDTVVALSNYCVKTYSDFYDIPKEKFVVIPNGIDPAVWFPPKDFKKRDPDLFIFASAPIKGYRALDFVFDNIRRHRPNARLMIFASQQLHNLPDSPLYIRWLENIKEQKGVIISKPVPQKELSDLFRKAYALLMPNEYPEICSNLLLQARACGLPVVTSPIGSAPEFIEHENTGMLSSYTPNDKFMWWYDYTMQVIKLIKKPELFAKICINAPEGVHTWDEIGDMWNGQIVCSHKQTVKEYVGIH